MLSRKETPEEYKKSQAKAGSAADGRKQQPTLGSNFGGMLTLCVWFIMIVVFINLFNQMHTGAQDSIKHEVIFSDFQGPYKEVKITNHNFVPSIEIREMNKKTLAKFP